MTDTITLPRSVVAGALHALDLSQALLESSKSIHHTTILEEYKALRAAMAQQAEQVPSGKTCSNCTFHYKDIDMKPCGNCERGDNIEDNWMPMSTGQIALAAAPKGWL